MRFLQIGALLLLIVLCKCKNHPCTELFDTLLPEETGIDFTNKLTESLTMNGLYYEYYYNGAGLAVADFNNDGLQDVFFLSNLYPNRLYLNKGSLKFKDISKESGISDHRGFPTGATTVDINCDGLMDIYISNSGKYTDPELRKNKLWVNKGISKNGIPTFKEESSKYGLDIDLCSTQAAFFDYDRDGDLDMFLINHYPDVYAFEDIEKLMGLESNLTGDRLFQNQNGKFIDVSKKAGIVNNSLSYGLGVGVSDLNNDGWPDVYVSNDFSAKDLLYLNNMDGTFSECIDESITHMSYASMGNDLADFNNDGWSDIVTLEMMAEDNYTMKTSKGMMNMNHFQTLVDLGQRFQYMTNTLQMNNGVFVHEKVPVFSDIGQIAGISSTDWSWAPLMFDMDNDGLKDLFIANGIKRDFINEDYLSFVQKKMNETTASGKIDKNDFITSVLNQMPERRKNNYFFHNKGDLKFEKMNGKWAREMLTCSNGAAYADFDNDGDIDIVVNDSDGPSIIYKNNCREKGLGNFLQFKLVGPGNNPTGIGTKIVVYQADQIQMQEQYLTRGFLSSICPVINFGLGTDKSVLKIQVIWPDGKEQIIAKTAVNQILTLRYDDADQIHIYTQPKPSLFQDITGTRKLSYKHDEDKYNDFGLESLLPHKLSDLGPGMAVADVNNDGMDDFFVGGAKGYSGKLYIQTKDSFKLSVQQPWSEDKDCEDVKALFFDADGDADPDLYVVSGGNEYEKGSPQMQDRLYLNNSTGNFRKEKSALPDMTESGSCVIACDYDSDGDLDLFVGGRQIPGRYPLPASSHLLRNDSKQGAVRFTDVTSDFAPQLKDIGMVTDASFTDIDGDGKPDLVIVGEWMSLKIFKNTEGTFKDITEKTGLSNETGWWNCISSADFDHDGDMDLIAGNLGLNSKNKASKKYPFEVYSSDFDNNGTLDIVLGYYNNDTLYPVRGLESSYMQMPFIKQKFPTYRSYGKASLADIYGSDKLKNALNYKACNFATSYFENNGDGTYRVCPLQNPAQISTVNSIIIEDIDQDGNLDLVLAGNQYGSEPETPRNDAGIGLYLNGDGNGDFVPVKALISGLFLNGEVRQMSLIQIGKNHCRGIIAAKNNDMMQIIQINKK